jgi:hypothetical protein
LKTTGSDRPSLFAVCICKYYLPLSLALVIL